MAVINDTEEELEQQLKFEGLLAFRMKRIFKRIIDDEVASLRTFGSFLPVANYVMRIEETLKEHYKKVMTKNSKDILNELGLSRAQLEMLRSQIDSEIEAYATKVASTHAALITETNNKDLENSFAKAIALNAVAAKEGIFDFDYIDAFKHQFTSALDGRVETIAMTDTQNATETSKYMSVTALTESLQSGSISAEQIGATLVAGAVLAKKTWDIVDDNVTRPWHREANGQTVSILEDFVVKGEALSYPGDPKGSLDNIMNCRCKAKYSIF